MSQTNPQVDMTFAHEYEVLLQPELSGHDEVIEFPSSVRSRPEIVLVQVEPRNRTPWVGLFRGGELTRAGKTGIYTWPSPDKLCIVCAGAAYLVIADAPGSYEELGAGMVTDVLAVPERGLVVMTDPWEVLAYDQRGLAWRTGRIAVDGLRLTGKHGDWLEGVADSLEDDEVPFRVELGTGRVDGGLRLG